MENDRLTSARIDLLYDYSKMASLSMRFDFLLTRGEIKVGVQNLVAKPKELLRGTVQ